MNFRPQISLILPVLAVAVLGSGCQSQRHFASPEDAATALAKAAGSDDRSAARELFGPRTDELRSGDPEQDRQDVTRFARALQARHEIRLDSDDSATVLVGDDAWPFAVPLVREDRGWRFDTEAGIEELDMRRIGRNELKTIQACRTLVEAQREYSSADRDGDGVLEYARKLMSEAGQKDGLYWEAGPGGLDPSPIGPAFALAATRTGEGGERLPFYGYRYKLLLRQAGAAPGGALEYLNGENLTAGWAAIAYPDEYGVSGVMSFLVSDHGEVYESDLGPEAATICEETEAFDPGPGWSRVGGQPEGRDGGAPSP